ncbi:unnamed protein product [Mytilus edulis]|uniref:Uncharacterized protein n=1 Tax=Mytilus edulis TaxID=6550 RepID=A0A8S3SQP4_MYTED|nr:unnamed protein product [Mytilus edulis]
MSLAVTVESNTPLGELRGAIAVNTNLTTFSLPYAITITSERRLNLTFVIKDEYTYFATGSPLVIGAEVKLVNPRRGYSETRLTYNNTDNFPLIVGLGVGIPLFFIVLALIIVLCVYNSKRHKSNSLDDDDLNRTMPAHEGFFTGAISGRFNSWNRPGDSAFHGRWDDESVDSERGGAYDNEMFRGKDPYVYDNNKGGKPASFSWDFIFQSLPGNGQQQSVHLQKTKWQANNTPKSGLDTLRLSKIHHQRKGGQIIYL